MWLFQIRALQMLTSVTVLLGIGVGIRFLLLEQRVRGVLRVGGTGERRARGFFGKRRT